MAQETSAPISPSYADAKSPKSAFLDAYVRDHATTLKVLKAFPPTSSEFRPHERSSTARQLAWTFVVEERLLLKAVRGEPVLGSGFGKAPDTWDEVLDAFDKGNDELMPALRDENNSDLTGTVTFFVGPKQTGPIPTADFMWFMLHDQIHHRGQLAVYVRMTGGKVPSIYGPSADEPWF